MDEFSSGYSRIRQYVFCLIATALPEAAGVRLTTERELCELFDVSRGTVRKALQMLVDEGLLVRRPHHGTFIHPAALQMTVHHPLLGVIIQDGEQAYWGDFAMAMLDGALRGCMGTGYRMRPLQFMGDALRSIRLFGTTPLAGIVWLAPTTGMRENFAELLRCGIPVGVVDPPWEVPAEVSVFDFDLERYAEEVTELMIARGRRKFVFMGPEWSSRKTLVGIRRAMERHGLKSGAECVLAINHLTFTPKLEELLRERPEVDALVLPSDCPSRARELLASRPDVLTVGSEIDACPEAAMGDIRVRFPFSELAYRATSGMIAGIAAGEKRVIRERLHLSVSKP